MTPAHPLLLFRAGFGFYLVFHTGYQLQYGTSSLESLFVAPAAFLLMLWPGSGALFALTVALHFADLMLRPPIQSNHTMMSFFLTFGIGLAYLSLAWRERRLSVSAAQHFELFAPLGRLLLIGMYVFGTFHKINSDFLNPAVSCAVALWRSYGFPAWLQEAPSLHVAIAYGTLVLETVAIVLLLIPRLRWAGMLLGLGFHGFLGFATFQNYHAFSLLAFLLHALFLPPDALARLRESGLARRVEALGGTPRRLLVGLLLAAVAIMLPAMVLWAVICAGAIGFVLLYGRERDAAPLPLIAPAIAVNLLAVLFFANGMLPYTGHKTGQTVSMFSNLTTEGGQSNHLLMPNLGLFPHQEELVEIVESEDATLIWLRDNNYRLVKLDLVNRLAGAPHVTVSFREGGTLRRHTPETPLPEIAEAPPALLRKFLVFKPVLMTRPRPCDRY